MLHHFTLIIIVFFVASGASGLYWDPRWDDFKREHNKAYPTLDEEIARYKNWKESIDLVESHNNCEETYKLKMNKYADMNFDEFLRQQTGLVRYKRNSKYRTPSIQGYKESGCTPKTFDDWRIKGCVTAIKNQGKCGACWAFAAIAALESAYCIKTGTLVNLSEQQLIDCNRIGNLGCDGGSYEPTFEYTKTTYIETDSDYPYNAAQNACAYQPAKGLVKEISYVKIPDDDEHMIKNAVSNIAPVAVSICADRKFMLYSYGIYRSICSKDNLNHAILIVGYDISGNSSYFIGKNSYGTHWGMDGYVYMAEGLRLLYDPAYPIV